MKTDFNRFGVFGADKSRPPSSSWWTEPELQHNRIAFQQRLVTEELRMLGGKFGRGPTHNKFQNEK